MLRRLKSGEPPDGAQLVLMPEGKASLPDLARAIREQGITTLWLTAGLFHVMVDEHPDGLKSLHQLLAGGDVLSVAHVRRFLDEAGQNCSLINGYGPTEHNLRLCHRLEEAIRKTSVPIGRPWLIHKSIFSRRCDLSPRLHRELLIAATGGRG